MPSSKRSTRLSAASTALSGSGGGLSQPVDPTPGAPTPGAVVDNSVPLGDDVPSAVGVGVTSMSPIALSLLNAVKTPLTASRTMREDVTTTTPNPRPSSKMPDSAKYWHNGSGNVLVLRIPCLVDVSVPGVRIGKTLDLYGDEITDDKFKKLRAAFGFRCLPAEKDMYPPQVLKAASEAQRLLYTLQTKCEALREQSDSIRVSGFFRADTATDSFQYLVRTEPIFIPFADPSSCTTIPLIDLTGDSDSDSADSKDDAVFSSPSKLRAQVASKSSTQGQSVSRAAAQSNGYTLRDWAPATDTTSPFYQFVGTRNYLWDSRFNVPEIRDRNGVLVQPADWEVKLSHLTPVTIDVVLKLWEIRASQSRIYQLILRKVQIHPSNLFSLNIVQPDFSLKEKRREYEDDAGPPSPSKKSKAKQVEAGEVDAQDIAML